MTRIVLAMMIGLLALPGGTFAATIVDADVNGHDTPANPARGGVLYRIDLLPLPASHLTAGLAPGQLTRVQTDFPGWTFTNGAEAPGEFMVVKYDTDVDRTRPFPFQVDYVPGAGGPPAGTLQWIQFIDTNRPKQAGLPRPYLDPFDTQTTPSSPTEDTLPFYWTDPQRVANTALGGGVELRFTDRPSRSLILSPVEWTADLYLVSWNGVDTPGGAVAPEVTILDGVRWGFGITCVGRSIGANTRGGVGGDKFEEDGEQGDELVCVGADAPVPGPAGAILLILGGLAAGLYSARRAAGRAPSRP